MTTVAATADGGGTGSPCARRLSTCRATASRISRSTSSTASPATPTPLTRPLTDLLAVTYGPLPVLTDALAVVPGVERAFIYGSWAARYQGEPGPVPDDVDVLVIGTADADDLDAVAEQAQRRLGQPVNIRRVGPARWRRPDARDPFLRSVQERPLVELQLE